MKEVHCTENYQKQFKEMISFSCLGVNWNSYKNTGLREFANLSPEKERVVKLIL